MDNREIRLQRLMRKLVCKSPAMQRFFEQLAPLVDSTAPLLLRGEEGVGKSWLAEQIHAHSERGEAGIFKKINTPRAGSEPSQAEMFGVAANAYTGSGQARPGQIERASGGTVFFEELGRSPDIFQGRILTVITDKEVMRIGGVNPRPVDVRWIAATHQDLEGMVQRGEFERALLRRFSAHALWIPALRERRADIPLLIANLAARFGVEVEPGAVEVLQAHDWPGNLHQLAGVVEGANGLGVLTVEYARSKTGADVEDDDEEDSSDFEAVDGQLARAYEAALKLGTFDGLAIGEEMGISPRSGRRWGAQLEDIGRARRLTEDPTGGRGRRVMWEVVRPP